MPRRDLHKKAYDEGTKEKLELYRDYLREWLHVFTHVGFINTLQIFDFFAGPGCDLDGNPGSPVITCNEIINALNQRKPINSNIRLFFNEYAAKKFNELSECLDHQKKSLQNVEFATMQADFHNAFEKWKPLMQRKVANLLFLDQNGVDQITKPIFQSITQLRHTDFLFFISSSTLNRFKDNPEIRKNLPITDDDLDLMNGNNVHRLLANAYPRWVPNGVQYFLGSFSIKKGANVYGLVFGSGHPLGIDKFLHVAWNHGGEANFDIDGDGIDPMKPYLFEELEKSTKRKVFEKEVEKEILNRNLKTNKDIYLFALRNGILPSHAKDALNLLVKKEKLPKQKFHVSYGAWNKGNAESVQYFTGENK